MKRLVIFCYYIFFCLLTFQGFSQTPGTSVPVKTVGIKKDLSQHRAEIQKVVLTESNGVFRGFSFGAPITTVKEKEVAKFIADGKDFAIFKQELNEKEFAEIIYYLDEAKNVKGFGIEFIISEENYKEEENIVEDFQSYFTDRYGKFVVNSNNDEVWDAGTYTVEMGDSSEGGNVLEIEIEIFQKVVKKK